MTQKLKKSQILSKIFLTATMELIKYDLGQSLYSRLDFNETLKGIVGDLEQEAVLLKELSKPHKKALSVDNEALTELYNLKEKIFNLVDDLLIFELNFDLTEDEYPLVRVFPSNKAVTDGERGEVFNDAFIQAYDLMFRRMGSEQRPAEEVIQFLESVRIKNPAFFKYLGLNENEISYDKIRKLLKRIENKSNSK